MNIDLIENCNIILPIQKDKSLKEHASIILRGKMQPFQVIWCQRGFFVKLSRVYYNI